MKTKTTRLGLLLALFLLWAPEAIAQSVSYEYDELNRLVRVLQNDGGDLAEVVYTYDAAGNRSAMVVPEPHAVLSLGLGVLVVILLARHRRRNHRCRVHLVASLAFGAATFAAWEGANAQSLPPYRMIDLPLPPTAQQQASTAATQASFSTEITPEIQELARALRYDVDLIYEYVYSQIRYEPMWASNKGAHGTLIDRSGGDFDQASLMVALLRESGYTASFVYGKVSYFGAALQNWMEGPEETNAFAQFLARTGRALPGPKNSVFGSGGSPVFAAQIERVWVKVNIDGTDYVFDPAFKVHAIEPGIDVAAAMGYNQATFLSSALSGSTQTADYIQSVNRANIESSLAGYANNLISEIRTNHPGARRADIVGGSSSIDPLAGFPRNTTLPNTIETFAEWIDIPASFRSTLRVQHLGIDETLYADSIAGKRLTIFYQSNQPVLRLDGATIATGNAATPGSDQTVQFEAATAFDVPTVGTSTSRVKAGDSLLILNGWSRIGKGRVRHHEARERQETFNGGALLSEPVLGESLAVLAAAWLAQTTQTCELAGRLVGAHCSNYSTAGVVGQRDSPYLDIGGALWGVAVDTNSQPDRERVLLAWFGHASAFEGGAIVQVQSGGQQAVSTVPLVGLANDQSARLFDATSSNFASIQPQLSGYHPDTLADVQARINNGERLILPQIGNIAVDDWSGTGYISLHSANAGGAGYIISGGLNGGNGTTAETLDVETENQSESGAHDQSADPIDLVTGDFLLEAVDLTVGSQQFPLGLSFERSYNSGSRYRDGPLGLGWTHSFDLAALPGSDGFQGLGEDSPVDAAAAIVELFVTLDLLSLGASSPTQGLDILAVTTLAERWFLDQLTHNTVTVSAPDSTLVFVRLPDGSFSPPPGSAANLSVEVDGSYLLTTKHGVELAYDTSGRVESWDDLNGNSVSFSYSGSDLQSVSDAASHTLTFTYSGNRLSSVSDGTRSYAYGYDAAGNLTSVTDANSEVTTFQYQSDGLLSHVFTPAYPANAHVTNTFNALGRVETQLDALGNPYTYYIAPGARSEEVDPSTASTVAYYDDRGKTTREIDALGFETVSEYDGEERMVYTEAPEGNATEFEYDDQHNRILERRYPKSGSLTPLVHTRTYHPVFNRIESDTDPRSNTTSYFYDAKGNVDRIEQPQVGGQTPTTSFTYNSRGQVLTVTDPEGTVTSHTYDPATADLLSSTEDFGGLGLVTTFTYNTAGDRTTLTDPRGNTVTFVFDNMRRVTQIESPAPFNYLTRFTHDENGQVTAVERQMGSPSPWQTTLTSYTFSGRVATITEPGSLLPTTVNTYDVRDQLDSVTDAKGRVTEFQYDERGALKRVVDASTNTTEEYTYTPNGHRASVKDANGNLTGYRYDAFDRLEFTDYPDGTSEQQGYDAASNVASRTTRAGETISYTFDSLNRVTFKAPSGSPSVTFSYDLAGRVLDTTDGTGTTIYTYDALGRLGSVEDPNGRLVTYDYDPAGNRSQLTYPDGFFITYEHDEMNRLEVIRNLGVTALAMFGYDSLSRRTSLTYANGTSTSYSYEIDDDVSQVAHQFNGGTAPTFDYTYDEVHNRTQTDVSSSLYVFDLLGLDSMTYAVNNLNQYTTVTIDPPDTPPFQATLAYDTNGNLEAPTHSASHMYDAENQLVVSTTPSSIDHEYNAFGIRTAKFVAGSGTHYVLDGSQVLVEYDDMGVLQRRYVYAGTDQPIQMQQGAMSWYYHQDALGSVVALTDMSGALAESYAYGPYGEVDQPSALGNPYLFAGREFDSEIGLYYNRARFYDPVLGRFMQPDPSGYSDDLNLYAYVGGNPVNFVDPLGLFRAEGDPNWVWDFGWIKILGGDPDVERQPHDGFLEGALSVIPISRILRFLGFGGRGAGPAISIPSKIEGQMAGRGWTAGLIDDAVREGKRVPAINRATGNPATRYVHPTTGQSVVVDDVTGQVIHVGGPGFRYGPGSGDLP